MPLYFRLKLSSSLVDFYNFSAVRNGHKYFKIIGNFLTQRLDDVIAVTYLISRKSILYKITC